MTLKAGLLTWCAKTLEKLCATARVTETAKKRTVKIGGIKNQNNKKYLIRFLHEDSEDGNIRVVTKGFPFSSIPIEMNIVNTLFRLKIIVMLTFNTIMLLKCGKVKKNSDY